MNKQQIDILLLEDNEDDVRLVHTMLSEAKNIRSALHCENRLQQGIERLNDERFDIILLDLNLPDSSGLDTLRRIRAHAGFIPVVIMTDLNDEQTGTRAMTEGAQDYIIKGRLRSESLDRIIRYAIERKENEKRLKIANQILTLLNRHDDIRDIIRDILSLIKREFNIDAVAIRVKNNDDDFPYFETAGFTKSHIGSENCPFEINGHGRIRKDKNKEPIPTCLCGTVLLGRTDSSMPCFTADGSFWTNSIARLQSSLTEKDIRMHLKKTCQLEAYESVALIPLKDGKEIVGLLQCNHGTGDLFTPELITCFEGIGASIGNALQRVKAETSLIKSEARFQKLIRENVDAIIVIDQDERIQYVNSAGIEMFNRNRDELIGTTFGYPLIEEGSTEIEIIKPDGRILVGEMRVAKTDWTGRSAHITSIRDITSRKNEERQRKKLEEQLRQAQKMESIGTLAGGIAHDFNNILFPIIGYTEMMLAKVPENSDFKKKLTEVLTASCRARDLVQQILTFSRQAEKELKPLKAQLLIKELLKFLKASLPSTIRIVQRIDKDCNMVLADPTHIHQVAMNLITNAYHAMEADGGTLTIDLANVAITANDIPDCDLPAGAYVRFSVSDTGHGIEKHISDRIFDPYFTTKDQSRGTGLGLSIIHGIVKSYKGDVSVTSESGKGSTFRVYLPAIDVAQENRHDAGDCRFDKGKGEHILLVDDEAPILKLMKGMLNENGYRVTDHSNSVEALDAFRSSPGRFDLVITDMTMPNMTGEALVAQMKQVRPGIPIILCTGFSNKISKEKASLLGVADFLMKPIVSREFFQKIRSALDKQAA